MNNGRSIYPVEPWRITEEDPSPEDLERNATIFFLGNGYLGIRGGGEEYGFDDSPVHKGAYINGFYETEPIVYGESAYGFARNKQVMLNLADATEIGLAVKNPGGDEVFGRGSGRVKKSRRYLDMKEGLLRREVTWISPSGVELNIDITRVVSLERQHVACSIYRVRSSSGPVKVEFRPVLNGRTANARSENDPRVGSGLPEDTLTTVHLEGDARSAELARVTTRSKLKYACRAVYLIDTDAGETEGKTDRITHCFEASGDDVTLTSFIAYASSREGDDPLEVVRRESARAAADGADALLAEHREYLHSFWKAADIRIGGDDALQQGIRYNLFALLQSAGRDGIRSIAAKGLSGEGYEGHYFWDTEIYVLPFMIYTFPDIARSLLEFRHSILNAARERAAVLSERGALFPWRTIAGEEASAYFLAGTAQYHINADIIYGARKYLQATGDREFLENGGAEMAVETARLWLSLGAYIPGKGFCLNCVTGPDEYTALVDNNLYTNIMARGNLEFALETVEYLQAQRPERWQGLKERLSVTDDEPAEWRRAAENMYIPYDRKLGVHPQDDFFFQREEWDFAGTPPENYPLLLHYHPLVIYRHRVLKQPDTVLATVLRGECFSRADRRRNFLFYDPITTGDSSLGPCIRSVAAAEIGNTEDAYRYFMRTARMDLDDVNKNVRDGIHTAAMAGAWISLVYGFAGMRETGDTLSFDPRLPERWDSVEFRLAFRGCRLLVALGKDEVTYTLDAGEELELYHRGTRVRLAGGQSRTLSLKPRLEAVLFDLDGVVTDTAELHYRAWKRLADELGIPFDRRVNEALKGIGRRDSFLIILEAAGASMPDGEIEIHIAAKNGYYRDLLRELTPEDILPGIPAFLEELKAAGIRTALISASRNAPFILERLSLREAFDAVVDPAEVVIGKPDPEICFVAAAKLGLPEDRCIGIEDAAAGVEAIRSAGMVSVGIGPAAREADLPLTGTEELSLDRIRQAFKKRYKIV